MQDIGEGTIRRIDWIELTPIVLLLRIFNITLSLRILFIALIGLQLNVWVNALSGIKLWNSEAVAQARQGEPWYYVSVPVDVLYSAVSDTAFSVQENPILLLWLFNVILIWVVCSGLICRIVAVRLTVDESESLGNLLLFLRKRGISFISAPFLVLVGIACCWLPVKLAGWLLAIPFVNYVAAILFPIPFAFACLTVFLAVVLAAGWMLLFAAVSVDGSDGFDAISRMFSYVCQRPLHYIVYWFCCGILGYLGCLLVMFVFVFPAINLCGNAVVPTEQTRAADSQEHELLETLSLNNEANRYSPVDSPSIGFESIVRFWVGVFFSIPLAYVFAWFWTSSVAIYLLLRRSVDATPFNEVYRVVPPKVRTLPVVKSDTRGAPEIVPTESTT